MKAITLWQPWASLLACGAKKYETRSWATSYRGPIAIHAAAKSTGTIFHELGMSKYTHPEIFKAVYESCGCHIDKLPIGYIIATAELVACHEIRSYIDESAQACFRRNQPFPNDYELITGNEYLFGDWTPGRYAWEFVNMKMLPEPIPAKGRQGLWNWEDGRK